MSKIYFKAVSRSDFTGSFCSVMACELPAKYCLTYEIGKTTTPKVGRIFVFDTYEHAKSFANENNDCTFAICKGTATKVRKPQFLCGDYGDEDVFVEFWNKSKKSWRRSAPIGTLSCSSFTPAEIVWQKRGL